LVHSACYVQCECHFWRRSHKFGRSRYERADSRSREFAARRGTPSGWHNDWSTHNDWNTAGRFCTGHIAGRHGNAYRATD
jgi:hypothetical protein